MSSGFEKSVKGATKIKLAAPKSKYVEHILVATHTGEHGVAEIFRFLQLRLRDSTWTIVFKALIVVHFMIRDGQDEVTLKFLASSPNRKLAINNFTEVQTQGRNIRAYADYLTQRAVSYGSTKVDYVRRGEGRLKGLTIDKGLLRETEAVQDQIKALCRCDFLSHEPENEITLTAFRLLTMDLLVLFNVMNEGTILVLEQFFEMSKPDAERALRIYRAFVKQTEQVVRYLSIARHYDHATRLEIPKIKHAPTSLTGSLEEYLKDPDFDINRRQYLAQLQAKKGGKSKASHSNKASESGNSTFPEPRTQPSTTAQARGPAPDLIDFFESIEHNQQQMVQGTYQQPQYNGQLQQQQPAFQQQQQPQANPFINQATGMPIQQQQQQPYPLQAQPTSNPFLQMQQQQALQQQQTQFQPQQQFQADNGQFSQFANPQQNRFSTGLQSIPQSNVPSFQQQPQQMFHTGMTDASSQQSTNPFRQSMMSSTPTASTMSSFTTATNSPLSTQPTGGNPFGRPVSSYQPQQAGGPSPFGQQSINNGQYGQFNQQQQQIPQYQQQHQPGIMAQPTGTNPFARLDQMQQHQQQQQQQQQQQAFPPQGLMPNATDATNPFRQSAFVNQQTGIGWQNSAQGTIGGIPADQVGTVPIFPRPGMG